MPVKASWFTRPAVALVLALGFAGAADAAPFRLILTHLEPPLVPNSVMDLALDLGYFEREGVDVELVRVQQTPSAVAALQAGEGEMANIGLDALLLQVAQGNTGLKAVTSPNKALPYLIAAKQAIAAPADLVGKSFGIGRPGSIDHSLSTKVLAAKGVDVNAIDFVAIGQPNVRGQALAAGQIDATTMSIGVWMAMPDKTGLHVLIDQDAYYEAAPVLSKINVVTQKALDERHDDVVAVVRALVKISRDFAADPSKWVDAIAKYQTTMSKDDLATLAATFGKSWTVNGGMSPAELRYSSDWLYGTEDFKAVPKVALEQWADLEPVETVLKELGTDAAADVPAP